MSELREAAKELVRLKDIKERIENPVGLTKPQLQDLYGDYTASKDAAWEALRQALTKEAESGWISVEERLPDSPCVCLVAVRYESAGVHLVSQADFWRTSHINWGFAVPGNVGLPVTHWQPLPAPPQQQGEGD